MEHRCGRRSALDVPVRVHLSAGRAVEGRMLNLSLSGAWVRLESRVPALSRVVLEVDEVSLRDARMHLIAGYAVRETGGGIGVEWSEFAPAAVTVLLARTADRPAALYNTGHWTEVPRREPQRSTLQPL